MYYLLQYDVTDDYIERRAAYRDEHLLLARASAARGELRLGGALSAPADRALLVFEGADRSVAEEFAGNDPYVKNGIVKQWTVREWTVVVGADHRG